ncbi:MAG: AAA family ATPase [Propionicimonas sp.]
MDVPPPHSRDDEVALVACAWHQPDLTVTTGVEPADFYGTDTEALWHAITRLRADRIAPDPVLALQRVDKRHRDAVNALLIDCAAGAGVPSNAPIYASRIRELAHRRALLATSARLQQLLAEDAPQEAIEAATNAINTRRTTTDWRGGFTRGGAFLASQPDDATPLWGRGGQSLWSPGEALMIAGPQGTGKTTIAQQLALGRMGLAPAGLLGLPVLPGERNVLYLAMDRPQQARRSLQRMVTDSQHGDLDDRLVVWAGPPPRDLARHTDLLTEMCREADADTCIVDSLKDAFLGLSDDEAAAAWNRARQTALRDGIQLVELHHNRKPAAGARAEAPTIADVYGSTWITSGAGSVILLGGNPGDPFITLQHIKQPAEEVGPLKLSHDHEAGQTTVQRDSGDLLAEIRRAGTFTATQAAATVYRTETPSRAQVEKMRRRLTKMADQGLVVELVQGSKGGASKTPQTWGAAARQDAEIPITIPITLDSETNPITDQSRQSRDEQNPLSTQSRTQSRQSRTGPITPEGVSKDPPADDPGPIREVRNPEFPGLPHCQICGRPVDPDRPLCHECVQAESVTYHRQKLNGHTALSAPGGMTPQHTRQLDETKGNVTR